MTTHEITATWNGIDTRRVLPTSDLALVTRLGEALMEGDRLHLELPATLHQIRWHHTDGTKVDTTPDPDEPPTGHHDPTGNAGIGPDRSAADLRRMRRLIEAAINALDQAAGIAANYPTQAAMLPDLEPTPGEDWCRCCWKHDKVCQPVTTRPDGSPYYRGLCRWCGQWTKTLGGEPPTWMVRMRHRGEVITEGHAAKAKAEVARLKPKAKGAKVRSKKRTVHA